MKPFHKGSIKSISMSHPSWVCGLKLFISILSKKEDLVTPFVGVWIETEAHREDHRRMKVTPFVGVWIETLAFAKALPKV